MFHKLFFFSNKCCVTFLCFKTFAAIVCAVFVSDRKVRQSLLTTTTVPLTQCIVAMTYDLFAFPCRQQTKIHNLIFHLPSTQTCQWMMAFQRGQEHQEAQPARKTFVFPKDIPTDRQRRGEAKNRPLLALLCWSFFIALSIIIFNEEAIIKLLVNGTCHAASLCETVAICTTTTVAHHVQGSWKIIVYREWGWGCAANWEPVACLLAWPGPV